MDFSFFNTLELFLNASAWLPYNIPHKCRIMFQVTARIPVLAKVHPALTSVITPSNFRYPEQDGNAVDRKSVDFPNVLQSLNCSQVRWMYCNSWSASFCTNSGCAGMHQGHQKAEKACERSLQEAGIAKNTTLNSPRFSCFTSSSLFCILPSVRIAWRTPICVWHLMC